MIISCFGEGNLSIGGMFLELMTDLVLIILCGDGQSTCLSFINVYVVGL